MYTDLIQAARQRWGNAIRTDREPKIVWCDSGYCHCILADFIDDWRYPDDSGFKRIEEIVVKRYKPPPGLSMIAGWGLASALRKDVVVIWLTPEQRELWLEATRDECGGETN